MKVTRYFQSCLLIEDDNTRVLIDPSGQEKDNLDKFGDLDAVFYTHEHPDHFDAEMAQMFVEQDMAPVYANASTAKLIKASKTEVKDGQEFTVGGIKVKAIELPHCLMIDGSQGPQNTGYLINNKLFHAGDGKELKGLKIEVLAGPITGPDISLKDICFFTNQVSAKILLPIHYDYIGTKPEVLISFSGFYKQPFKIRPIGLGKSAEF
jgi:L-ascorbate metabolism protein UlaG (beta-lactamase superfamily)